MARSILSKSRIFISDDHIKVVILYVVMLSGGIIHHLQIYNNEMGVLATFIIAAISIFILAEYYWFIRRRHAASRQLIYFNSWVTIVFVFSLLVENYAVISGTVFGKYTYGPVLSPFVGDVPLAIGFAWINTLVPAMMISSRLIKRNSGLYKWLSAAMVDLLMVAFDIVLEKAAVELDYWRWERIGVPLQNYFAWFVLGFIFARIGLYLKVDRLGFPPIFPHIYMAQLGYFMLVIAR